MFVTVYRPDDGAIEMQRRMGPHEIMDARKFANKVADMCEAEIDDSDGYIPSCSGDIRVEFHQHKFNRDVIWSGESFYFKREE